MQLLFLLFFCNHPDTKFSQNWNSYCSLAALCCAGWILCCPIYSLCWALRESHVDEEDLRDDDCYPCFSWWNHSTPAPVCTANSSYIQELPLKRKTDAGQFICFTCLNWNKPLPLEQTVRMAEILFSRCTQKMKQSWSKINIWTITVPKNTQENKNKKQKQLLFPYITKIPPQATSLFKLWTKNW